MKINKAKTGSYYVLKNIGRVGRDFFFFFIIFIEFIL